MPNLFFVLFFFVLPTVAFAQNPSKESIQDGVTQAMNENFEACNKEDVLATMNSCSLEMPDRDKFEMELRQVFRDKDIYYRLVECELLEVKFPYALARIVQETYLENRTSATLEQGAYRNSSALVPDECVEYLNTFKYENGRWKLLVIVSEMKTVKRQSK